MQCAMQPRDENQTTTNTIERKLFETWSIINHQSKPLDNQALWDLQGGDKATVYLSATLSKSPSVYRANWDDKSIYNYLIIINLFIIINREEKPAPDIILPWEEYYKINSGDNSNKFNCTVISNELLQLWPYTIYTYVSSWGERKWGARRNRK